MANEIDYIKLVNKLIKLTQEKEITWDKEEPSVEMNSSFSKVKAVYSCIYKEKRFRIYEKTFKEYEEDIGSRYYWDSETILEIVDENNYSLFKFSKSVPKDDLLDIIKAEEIGIDSLISSIDE